MLWDIGLFGFPESCERNVHSLVLGAGERWRAPVRGNGDSLRRLSKDWGSKKRPGESMAWPKDRVLISAHSASLQ
jgi:hypothetical protein